jgi:hypothetical protein
MVSSEQSPYDMRCRTSLALNGRNGGATCDVRSDAKRHIPLYSKEYNTISWFLRTSTGTGVPVRHAMMFYFGVWMFTSSQSHILWLFTMRV